MIRLYTCITQEHDIWLVLVAGVICLLSTFTAFSLLRRTLAASSPHARLSWLATAAIVGGSGVWATHFVAMLAYKSYLPVQYDVRLTVLSVVTAITISFTGLALAYRSRGRKELIALAGAVVGAAVGAMHYVGMAAMEVPGGVVWDPAVIAVSLVLGIGLGSGALLVAFRR